MIGGVHDIKRMREQFFSQKKSRHHATVFNCLIDCYRKVGPGVFLKVHRERIRDNV